MQIKRLKLSGFKSFVEPAELRVEPGLTGVVGPNGCGKSNVLEAIRWVMGESSPKSMRGAGMDDVIFAGTATRPARDFAEVSLLVDRPPSERAGDTMFPAGEVEITRRIERGAGSAYRVNGRDVRAKDVSLIFADAATGAHSPALVSQGRISAVIAARPTERRQMLEEAAGISGLHARRKDAEQKLRAAETNLTRLDEMLGDMEQRSQALRRQAKAAERYRRLSDEIRIAEARLIFARWKEAAVAAETARAQAQEAEASVAAAGDVQRAAADVQSRAVVDLSGRRKAAELAREKAAELGHRLASLRTERDNVTRRIRELADRRRTLWADRQREEALASDAAASLARLEEEITAIRDRLADAQKRRETIDIRTVDEEDKVRAAEGALGRAQAEQASEQAEARVALAARDAARQRHQRMAAEVSRLDAQLRALADEAPLREAAEAARTRRSEAEARLQQATKEIVASEAARQEAALARDKAESELAAAKAAFAALESEARSLTQALQTNGGDKVINHLKADRGWERALAAALGDDVDAVLEGDGSRRWTGAELLAEDPPLPAECTPLADHVQAPKALARRLAQIGVVDTDDGSITLRVGQRLVTRDGQLRRWDGFVARGLGAAAAERLIRANRLAELEKDLPPARHAIEQAEAASLAARSAMAAARDAADAARRVETQAGQVIREAGREEDKALVELERLALQRTGLDERAARARAEEEEARGAVAASETHCRGLPDAAATSGRVATLRSAAEAAQQALAEVRAEAATHARTVGADRQRLEGAAGEQEEWKKRSAEAAKRHAEFGRRITEAERQAAELDLAPERLEGEIDKLSGQSHAATEAARAAAEEEKDAESVLRLAEARLAEAVEKLAAAREDRAGAVARAENQESRRREMGRISGEKFECPPPLLPEKAGFDPAALGDVTGESARLERLTQDRERIGPVNLVAEAELAELDESRTASQAEREELGVAIHRLRGSIGSLNREGRARLLTAFEAVDRHFRSLFTTLFEGGQAHLELVESDDPLEAGLEILAQPPGKRLSTLTLLSGGEQALTAVALIFALFLTNPAPICVLDEVDAPLDDANIERFCDLLDRMVAETDTRYLIVTHNAVTMSRMHRLFGVTMIEKGISRLVSVDLGGAENLLAAE